MTRTARPRILRLILGAVLLLAVRAETSAQHPVQPRGVLTRIPSAVGDGQGIAVRVVPPERPRYENGAPVVIGVNPGPHGATGRLGAAECGFVEVFFASTDFGKGPYDFGGPKWILGLRDVTLFALAKTADEQGRRIEDLTGEIPVLGANVGTIGLSHGGNACGAVMGLHGQDMPELAWYVSWESPYGEGAVGEELGSPRRANGRVNPAYDAETSRLDLSQLAYDPDLAMTAAARNSRDESCLFAAACSLTSMATDTMTHKPIFGISPPGLTRVRVPNSGTRYDCCGKRKGATCLPIHGPLT